ncbi:hypothetical protein [Pontibacter rugosus]|uniref:Uncharacterized protein n=1 Tax=Pontibacter rugosus TaxID=1745966 RepID=A0ABW3SKR9_9BACT
MPARAAGAERRQLQAHSAMREDEASKAKGETMGEWELEDEQ